MGLILPQQVKITLTSNNVKRYEKLGYNIPIRERTESGKEKYDDKTCYDIGNTIWIDVNDLPKGAHVKVDILCDYCNKEIIHKVWKDYVGKILNSDNPKCACKNCRIQKLKEHNIKMYNTEYYTYTDEFKEKRRITFNDKYGVDWPLSLSGIHEKANATLYANGNNQCIISSQQLYLSNLYLGLLNVPCKQYWLDIVLKDSNIDIEYDGKGHDLSVKTGRLSQEEFNKNELIREKVIRSEGYKLVRIISRKDYLPSDEILLQILEMSKQYFQDNQEHTWINWDIDNGIYKNALNPEGVLFNYGELRRVSKTA